ncbi:MAG: tryptophan synthase subunit alpha [Thermodesulfobacteriota bacterium]|nr:tryptophan synthase subunit alpha [Thermodesulfobacteriota bacterium]
MSRIQKTFRDLKKKGQAALIPFLVAGDPDLKTTGDLILKIAEAGADIIELGVPYSDPLADGPTIQAAAHRALQRGINLKSILNLTGNLKRKTPPLVIMTYFNPVFRYGLKAFAEDCRECGIEGVVIPDLPPEEAGPWIKEARKTGIDTIFLTAPTSSPERISLASKVSRGFIYHVSVTGVTGVRGKLSEDLELAVRKIREISKKPVSVGFGISTPEQAREVSRFADGIIVGSAIVKIIEDGGERKEVIQRVGAFISSLAAAIR